MQLIILLWKTEVKIKSSVLIKIKKVWQTQAYDDVLTLSCVFLFSCCLQYLCWYYGHHFPSMEDGNIVFMIMEFASWEI